MELAKINGPVMTVGGGKDMSFKIANNSKMFRILSDNLYQDKPGSIVREISCNALDSHIMAGTPEKRFTIHLPDQFEPWFAVRDYGTGLSPDAVENIFCSYGESTKDQSNEAVGAFGLGAKTPFAYSDQFNITSIFNGKKYIYSAYIAESGMPKLTVMAEMDTDEHNGVEIKLGVKPTDFNIFIKSVREQLRFLPVKPEIVNYGNGSEFNWTPEPEYLFDSSCIKIFKNTVYGQARLHIVQGPVGYPLDFNQVNPHLDTEGSAFLRMIQEIGANLYFPIGAIGVTASREGVEYNSHTIDSVKALVAKARAEITAWITKEIDSQTNVFEKARFVNDNSVFRSIINGVKFDLSPANRMSSGYFAFSLGDYEGFTIERERADFTGKMVKRKEQLVSIVKYTRNGQDGFRASRDATNDDSLVPEKYRTIAIVIRDTAKTPLARMRHYFKTNNLDTLYMLQAVDDAAKMDKKFINGLTKHLGGFDNIKLVSELPEAPKAVYDRTRTDYSRPTAYTASAHGGLDLESVSGWTRVYDKLDTLAEENDIEKAIYVTVDRQRIMDVPYQVRTAFADLARADMVDLPIYGIREKDVDKLAGTGIEWVKLEDYINEKTAAIKADTSIHRYILADYVKGQLTYIVGRRFMELEGLNPRLDVARLIRLHKRCERVMARKNVNSYMQRLSGFSVDQHKVLDIVRARGTNLFEKVPMIQYVSRNGYGNLDANEAKHIVAYINHFAG